MLNTIAIVVVVVLGLHIITKFAFFALPYRPDMAPRAYSTSSTAISLRLPPRPIAC